MKRSNNRHNFIAKADHGQLPSQSPFAKSEAEVKSAKKVETTKVNWKEVAPDVRTSTAKQELRLKLMARHSTTHQNIEKGAEPGTVGNVNKGLHPNAPTVVAKFEAESPDKDKDWAGRSKAELAAASANKTQSGKQKSRASGSNNNMNGSPGNRDRETEELMGDSSDEEGTTDVYGWRFDADGDEENEKNLRIGSAKHGQRDRGSPMTITTNTEMGDSLSKVGAIGSSYLQAAQSSGLNVLNSARTSFSTKMKNAQDKLVASFEHKEDDHPVLKHVKSLSQFAGATLLKTASFAAKSAIKISSKLSDDIGKWASHDEADQVGSLMERNDSFMKIHDLANSPTKDKVKKKRLEDLHAAIGEMRQFGEEAEHHAAAQEMKMKSQEKSMVQGLESALASFSFKNNDKHATWNEEPQKREKPPADLSLIGLQDHAIVYDAKEYPDAPQEEQYRTLLDVKDLSTFQQEYYSSNGKGLQPHSGRELNKQSSANLLDGVSGSPIVTAGVRLGMGKAGSVHSTNSTVATSQRPLSSSGKPTQLELKRPPSLQLTAGNRIKPSLKKGISFAGLPAQPDWEIGVGPGGGLPPLRGSSFRAPPPVRVEEDHTPAYIKQLRKTGSYLKEQFSKAKEQLLIKLPKLDSTPTLHLETGKERLPPKPTATNGFNKTELVLAPLEVKDGDSAERQPLQEEEESAGASGGRTPFSLLTKAVRATSFITGLKLSGATSPLAKGNLGSTYASSPNLSERHRSMMQNASPGTGLPVIYAPHSTRSCDEVSEASLYSHVTSLTNMLEVSDGQKGMRFRPSSMNHLDLSRVAEVPEHEHEDLGSIKRIPQAADVGPDLPEKEIGNGWKACWDFSAESVYFFNTVSGEATWIAPGPKDLGDTTDNEGGPGGSGDTDEDKDNENFFRITNNGLPRGLSEFNLGDSDLTIKTRKIAARHNLFSKLRSRYEGDTETEFTKGLIAKEYAEHAVAEENEIMKDYGKELEGWD